MPHQPTTSASDNCDIYIVAELTDTSFLNLGFTTLTGRAIVEAENIATCDFTCTVKDNEKLLITFPIDTIVESRRKC